MKYFKLIIISALILVFACDKEEFSTHQAETFLKYFGSDSPYEGVQVLKADNGGYVILGNIENPGRSQDICLIRTDMYGNTIGPVLVYGGLFDDYGYAIKKNEAGYIIAGSTKDSRLGDKNAYLVQIDNAGVTLWTSIIGDNQEDEAYDVIVLDNHDLVLTGYSNNENNSDLLIARTNSSGDSLWMRRHGLNNNNEIGNTIIQAGNYFIVGGSRNISTSESVRNGYLMQLTQQGTNPLPIPLETDGNSEVSSLTNAGTNTYYAACTSESLDNDQSTISLIKFRHDDRDRIEILWTNEYGEQLHNQAACVKAYDNSVVLSGTSGTNIGTGDLLLMKIDAEGNTPEYYYTGDGISFAGNGFDFTADGGYILTGTNYSSENGVITLVKLNNQGKF